MLRNRRISRLLSMIVVSVLLLASIPAEEVKATENGQDIFVITSFEKQGEEDKWELKKTTFEPGTEVEDMEFPGEWKVKGYLQSDEKKTEVERQLEKLEWKGFLLVKEGEDEKETEDAYTKESPEGNYLFTMQIPEKMVMAEGVKAPSQKIVIKKENPPASKEAKITSFKIGDSVGTITENADKNTIEVIVPYKTDVKALKPAIGISKEATCEPDSGTAQDFTNPVTYTVTAQDGETIREYVVTVSVAACGHEWKDATCTEPKTCSICGATEGEAKDHTWKDATCTEPETCSVCGATRGETKDHIWKDATCTAPETCSVCGATKGEAKGHTWKDATCTEPETCSVCGATKGEAKGHTWKDATCTEPETCSVCGATKGEAKGHIWKDATCTEPETCSVCGATQGKAKGHQWKEATCTDPKTCTVCGEKEGEALGHDWKPATCTEPETCARCALTRGAPLDHNWGEWKVTKQQTVKEGGLEERICSRCQVKEERITSRLNIIGKAKNNYISGIKENGVYGLNELLTISANGDGMGIEAPIANDVRYIPAGWKVTSYNVWGKAPYKTSFRVTEEGKYKLQVHFQKQIYDGAKWVSQKEEDVKSVNFTISASKVAPPKTADANPIEIYAVMLALAALMIIANAGWKVKKASRTLQSLAKNV